MLKGMFAESKLNVEGLLNLGAMGHDVHKGGNINTNYVLLADMKPRMKLDVAQTCMLLLLSLFAFAKGLKFKSARWNSYGSFCCVFKSLSPATGEGSALIGKEFPENNA